MAVYKDILPGYRIRMPTAKEMAMAVSKDIAKLRDHEAALLKAYQVCRKGLANLSMTVRI